jgi:hypothetical protein
MEPMIELEQAGLPKSGASRKALAIGTAAALALGAAGFATGRLTARSDGTAMTSAGGEVVDSTPPTPQTDAPVSTVALPSDVSAAPAEAASVMTAPYYGGGGGSGQYSQNAYEEPALDLISERTTAEGIVLRAHLQQSQGEFADQWWPGADFGDWKPADWCMPAGQLRISMNNATMANLGWASWYSAPKNGLSVSTFAGGYVEGAPVFGAAIQLAPGATNVTLTTADGRSDSAAPIADLALLAISGPITEDFTVTVERPESTTTTSAADLTATWTSTDYNDACQPPPPALPEPGEQPADPAAARAAAEESWAKARDFDGLDTAERLGLIDDPTGVAEAWDAIGASTYAEAAGSSQSVIRDFVFTSPTEAWVRYDVLTSVTNILNRYGILILGDDGVWRVTRATICQDIAIVPESACQPGVELILPPSAANDPRFNPTFFDESPPSTSPAVPATEG